MNDEIRKDELKLLTKDQLIELIILLEKSEAELFQDNEESLLNLD